MGSTVAEQSERSCGGAAGYRADLPYDLRVILSPLSPGEENKVRETHGTTD
jgi:hypothetical protein